MLFKMIEMKTVETLHLSSWAVTPEIMTEMLPASFPGLKFLDMELLDMRSVEEDAWVSVLRTIRQALWRNRVRSSCEPETSISGRQGWRISEE
jgi:hypothetical protein